VINSMFANIGWMLAGAGVLASILLVAFWIWDG
jgi:hypothetical protein